MSSQPDDLRAVADRVYGVAPADFIAERNLAAKAARLAGDRALADEIRRLPKPSAAASVVNALVRGGGDQFELVLQLGHALRAAQTDFDAATLKTLAGERRALLSRVSAGALDSVRSQGMTVGAAVLPEVEQTLQAVLADPTAAAAAASGRLVRALASTGIDDVDLEGAVGGPAPAPFAPLRAVRGGGTDDSADPGARTGGKKAGRTAEQKAAAARSRERAVEARDRAVDELAEATSRLREAQSLLDGNEKARLGLARRLVAVQKEADEIRERLTAAEGDSANAERSVGKAERSAASAEQARQRAEARLQEVEGA